MHQYRIKMSRNFRRFWCWEYFFIKLNFGLMMFWLEFLFTNKCYFFFRCWRLLSRSYSEPQQIPTVCWAFGIHSPSNSVTGFSHYCSSTYLYWSNILIPTTVHVFDTSRWIQTALITRIQLAYTSGCTFIVPYVTGNGAARHTWWTAFLHTLKNTRPS